MTTTSRTTLFCLHGLGLNASVFDALRHELGESIDVVGIDLPGFGSEPVASGVDVDDMAALVERRIRAHGAARWLLLGHSMGGKVATLAAARVLDGSASVFGLAGVVLLAASPPTPEPMDDESRAAMLDSAAGDRIDEAAAREFVDDNIGEALPADLDALAMDAVRASDPAAWRAWLRRGSLEDRGDALEPLPYPALIVAGGADGDLGEEAQRQLIAPWFPRARVEVIESAAHFLMLERPAELARLIRDFAEAACSGPLVPPGVARLIASDRTSARTRSILARRAIADDPAYVPIALTGSQLDLLRVLAARLVPQDGPAIDLAARVDAQLAAGAGDGWRHVTLPPDIEAYRRALDGLERWRSEPPEKWDELLDKIADGEVEVDGLEPAALTAWLEDATVDLVRQWLAHPATMAEIGFDGFATGGDRVRIQGFIELSAGSREAWEPEEVAS
jgi:pimeloyl-ACP methyl ester carboxylesterase